MSLVPCLSYPIKTSTAQHIKTEAKNQDQIQNKDTTAERDFPPPNPRSRSTDIGDSPRPPPPPAPYPSSAPPKTSISAPCKPPLPALLRPVLRRSAASSCICAICAFTVRLLIGFSSHEASGASEIGEGEKRGVGRCYGNR